MTRRRTGHRRMGPCAHAGCFHPECGPGITRQRPSALRLGRLQERADDAERIAGPSPSPQERQSIELYRTFCLVAIGNTDEANKAIESMVSRDPLYRPNMDDVPPRLRTVFSDARKRLLPALIQERYIIAKAAFDRSDYKIAAEGFTQVLIALSDPDIGPAAKQPPLVDLRVLASGFSDLTVRAMAPPPVPVVLPTVQAPPPPVAMAPREPVIYEQDAKNVMPPVVVSQEMPLHRKIPFDRVGVLEIVIDSNGGVESATMVQPTEALYDRRLLAAAKTWIYQPPAWTVRPSSIADGFRSP